MTDNYWDGWLADRERHKRELRSARKRAAPSKSDAAIVRARGACELCGWAYGNPVPRAKSRSHWKPPASWALEIDHIIPVSKGGTRDLANLQLLCTGCNARKWNHIQ